jgi:hypothetical protein
MTLEHFLTGQKHSLLSRQAPNVLRRVRAPKPVKPRVGSVKAKRGVFVADFETTVKEDDCRVWSWGIADIENAVYDAVDIGNSIDSFIEAISKMNSICYFHNLKFDGPFILDWLLNNDFRHVQSDFIKRCGTFKTLISDMGQYYSITVKWDSGHTTEFRDSLKKIPMPVKRIALAFKLEEAKGVIDYTLDRPVGHVITEEEADYLRTDVLIVAKAMKEIHDSGMKRLTVASDSLAEYKKLTGAKGFDRVFPVLSEAMDSEIRSAYRGGFTYCDPRFKSKITGSGLVLDVNSLYPSVMMDCILPFGEPVFKDGKYEITEERPLAIFSVTFTAKIKPKHIPCIQIKGMAMFGSTEYLSNIDEPVTLMVTNVDWDLYNEHYDIDVLEYGGSWLFSATIGMFDTYINKWGDIKANSKGGKREIAKLHLNALYGKFASNPNVTSKIPHLVDGVVKLIKGEPETRPPVYTAVGVFITSFARAITIRAAQENYDVFAYADTDSLHLLTDEIPTGIDVHPTKMGAWKLEYHFTSAFYIRAKAYIESTITDGFVVHIAGLPDSVTVNMTFDDIVDKKVFHGKLNPKSVPGGIVLRDIPFQLTL